MKRVLSIGLFVALMFTWVVNTYSKQDAQAQLTRLHQERQKLNAVREQLETQLGVVGLELKGLDELMVAAVKASHDAEAAAKAAADELDALQTRRRGLESRVSVLRNRILDEASAAYQRLRHAHWFVLVLSGIPVTETPHRQYLLTRLLESQAEDRDRYVRNLRDLQRIEAESRQQLSGLEQLRTIQATRKKDLAGRLQAKRMLWNRVHKDIKLKKGQDRAIAAQEKALKELIKQLHTELSSEDTAIHWRSIRTQKGKLPWPLKSRLITRFRGKPGPGKPRLAGVQLAPIGSDKQVRTLAGGRVRYADWFGGYGLMMIIDHGDGMMSVYAHNDALYKQIGDWVEDGEVVALAGSTGWVKQPLLYFEIRNSGKPVNPVHWCRAR